MEVYKLNYRNSVWLDFHKNIELEIRRLKNGKISVHLSNWGNPSRIKVTFSGAEATALDKKLHNLSFADWNNEYSPVNMICDGEQWDLQIEFVDGSKKVVHGNNAYPQCWNRFLSLIKWVKSFEWKTEGKITYKQAKKIALRYNKDFNGCIEYAQGYYFYVKDVDAVGGGYDVVVLKENGRAVPMSEFILQYSLCSKSKEIKF